MKHGIAKGKDYYLQALRGFAIMAVVLIHCLPADRQWVLYVRPFLNFGVALFIFLSGYLTPADKCENIGVFYKRRLGKILFPYVIWSLVYLVLKGDLSIRRITVSLCVGDASSQMYFLLVYAQLVLLTPFLYRLLAMRFGWLLWTLTPLVLILREALALQGVSVPHIMAFFGSWLIFYLVGMCWGKIAEHLPHLGVTLIVLCAVLATQMVAGFIWYRRYENWDLATSQLKISSMLFALAMIAMLMKIPQSSKDALSKSRMLTTTGDCSFGVYLFHMLILSIVNYILRYSGLDITSMLLVIFKWLFVLILSVLIVRICQLILPRKVQMYIGSE